MNRSYINYWQGLGRRITNYWLLEGDSTSLNPGNSALRDPGSPFYSLPLRSFGRVHHCRLSLTWIKSGSPKESKLLACGKAILASSNRARRYASFPPRERLVKIEIHLGLAGIKPVCLAVGGTDGGRAFAFSVLVEGLQLSCGESHALGFLVFQDEWSEGEDVLAPLKAKKKTHKAFRANPRWTVSHKVITGQHQAVLNSRITPPRPPPPRPPALSQKDRRDMNIASFLPS